MKHANQSFMRFRGWITSIGAGPGPRRTIAWLGGAFIAALVGLAAYDIVRGYAATQAEIEREMNSQARVIAEQTARSVQAVDGVLRHVAAEYKRGRLAAHGRERLDDFLHELTVGLKQIDGLGMFDAQGETFGVSWPSSRKPPNMAQLPRFQALRDDATLGFVIFEAARGAGDGVWIVPFARRLETAAGEFAGVVAARGRVDYFQQVYRDAYPDPSTRVALLHRNTTLLARHPPADDALGSKVPLLDELLAAAAAGRTVTRSVSPIDGRRQFGAIRLVEGYPLVVAVTRDADLALAPWRELALNGAVRIALLAALAAVMLFVTLRQLTRLQSARVSLEVSQERYALAVTGSNEGHWLWNMATQQVYVSAKLAELFYFDGGAQTMRDSDYFARIPLHPEDRERVHRNRANHVAGLTPMLDHEFRIIVPATGEVRWIHTRAQCFRDATGTPARMAGSTVDATQRKRAEEALRRSEERYERAMQGSSEAHWDWNLETGEQYLSPRLIEMYGLPHGEYKTREQFIAAFTIHPEDRAHWLDALQAHLAGQAPRYEVEYRVVLATGEVRWLHVRGQRFRDAHDGAMHLTGSASDITERKRAQAERERLEQQLRQAQKLEAIGTLAGGIAHDFNNILSAILGYGEMVQKEAGDGTRMRRHIDAAMSAGARAKSLVERILAFSRSGVGDRVTVPVRAVVAEALESVAATLPATVRLQHDLAASEAGVLGDATQIHQVVMNLCANAVHAMKSGGVLAVALGEVSLDAPLVVATNTLPVGRYVRLCISDSGSGIEARVLDRIFDPFFTTKEVGVGTGLGLSLVHGIVTDLGGGIAVDSELGKGTTFAIYLPWQRYQERAAAAEAPVELGAGQTVLLVDDEESLVRLGEETLAGLGYEPVGFTSPAAALEAFRAEPQRFDAVLTDEAMPGMNGSELCVEILRVRPATPIVLMSGYVNAAVAARAREAGAADVLAKPVVSRDLARSIAAVLERAGQQSRGSA